MIRVMLDLETLGTSPGCVVLSIGATTFDGFEPPQKFYVEINRLSSRSYGLTEDPNTLLWWNDQEEEARGLLDRTVEGGLKLSEALENFSEWLSRFDEPEIWANSPSFDCVVLIACYAKFSVAPPWNFHKERCFRTLMALVPIDPLMDDAVKHNALNDAINQATRAEEALTLLKSMQT